MSIDRTRVFRVENPKALSLSIMVKIIPFLLFNPLKHCLWSRQIEHRARGRIRFQTLVHAPKRLD
jgi:hypothetical protein